MMAVEDELKPDSKKNPTTTIKKKVVTIDDEPPTMMRDSAGQTATKSPPPPPPVVVAAQNSNQSSSSSSLSMAKQKKRSASLQATGISVSAGRLANQQQPPPQPQSQSPITFPSSTTTAGMVVMNTAIQEQRSSIVHMVPERKPDPDIGPQVPGGFAQSVAANHGQPPPPPPPPPPQHHHHHQQQHQQHHVNFQTSQPPPPSSSTPPLSPAAQPLSGSGSPVSTVVNFQLPPPQPPSSPSPPPSSSSGTTRTLSLSDPDLYYQSLPPVRINQTQATPLLDVDKAFVVAQQQQQQQQQPQKQSKQDQHHQHHGRQKSHDRSIRFDRQSSAVKASKSMRVLSSHNRQQQPQQQHSHQPSTNSKERMMKMLMAQSRQSLRSRPSIPMSRAKSTNLSQMRLTPYYSESDISDLEINNNNLNNMDEIYLDNNNASDDNEAMAILPLEARDLLMQEEEERKSRLAKESTSLLKVPGLGGGGGGGGMGGGGRGGGRRESKYFPGRIRKRVILKNGNINLCPEHVDKRGRRYLQDTFTTMVDIRWRWNLLVFSMGFFMSWFGFSIIWWLIAFSHSDFEHLHDEEWTPCVANLKNFASALLFSIETQHTIGYGSRFTTEECPEALFVMCLQSITGVMIQCFMVGFVFAKLSRPQKRSQTLMFSRYAIVNCRDSRLCLMFRVGDLRDRSHIIGCRISAQVIRKKITQEGEIIPYFHQRLEVKFDEIEDEVFLIWPVTIVHVIDQNSPFYTMNADDMMREKFEIIAILEGTVESTGQTVQARTSYLPSEILWGHRFEQLIRYRHDTGEYLVDYSKFNSTVEVDIPFCSAKELEEELKARNDLEEEQSDEEDQYEEQ